MLEMPPKPKKNLRTSCGNFIKTLVKLPVSKVHGILKAICYRHSKTKRNPPIPQVQLQNQEKLESMANEMHFFHEFERQYGIHHPFFYACQLTEVLRIANNESKFIFIYLHSPESPLTDLFCKRTLCSELVVQYLDANFVSWGSFANKGEGSDLVASLNISSFPFCAVVAPSSGDNIVVLQQVEGPVSAEALMEILHRTLDEQGSAFNAMRSEEERTRRENQQLRQEQDAAYLESLRKDKEKEVQQSVSGKNPRGAAMKGHSLTDGMIKETTRNPQTNGTTKGSPPTGRIAKETAKNPQANGTTKGSSPMHRTAKETTKNQQTNGSNGSKPNLITKIMIRLPNGERAQCNLCPSDTVRSVYNYIDSLDIPGMGSYQILTNFPKRIYGYEQLGMTLRDAGFHPSATIYVEKLP